MKVLAALMLCGLVHAQTASPVGSYGFLINGYGTDTSVADSSGLAILGVMNFDGTGNVSGTYTLVQGASIAASQNSQSRSGILSGSYSGNPDGSGSLNLKTDTGRR